MASLELHNSTRDDEPLEGPWLYEFIQKSPSAIAMFDREMLYLAASRRWMETLSLGSRDITGLSHYELFPEIPEHWKVTHRRCLAGETLCEDEDRFVRIDGSVQWFRWEVQPWITENGVVGGIVIFSEDITERKVAEEGIRNLNVCLEENLHELRTHQIELEMQNDALRKSQLALEVSRDRYFNLYEFATVSFITLTQTGQITEINLTGATLLGEDRKKLLKRRFDKFVVPENAEQFQKLFLRAFKNGENQNCELGMRKLDETLFYVHLISRLIKKENGTHELHLTLSDITEQKLAEAAKHQLESLLSTLTNRERDVLALALTGLHNKEISTQMNIHIRTVENHRSMIHSKTGVDSLLQLASLASKAGISLDKLKLLQD
jgi:PAS domain S-box-containing protein